MRLEDIQLKVSLDEMIAVVKKVTVTVATTIVMKNAEGSNGV